MPYSRSKGWPIFLTATTSRGAPSARACLRSDLERRPARGRRPRRRYHALLRAPRQALARPLRGRRRQRTRRGSGSCSVERVAATFARRSQIPAATTSGCRRGSARWRACASRFLWLWRLLLGGFAVVYLASECLAGVAAAAPAEIPRRGRRRGAVLRRRPAARPAAGGRHRRDRGPQPRDLAEFGWANRTLTVRDGRGRVVLRPGEMADAEIVELVGNRTRWKLPGARPRSPRAGADRGCREPVAPYAAPPPVAPPSKVRRRLLQALIVLALFTGVFFLDKLDPRWQNLSASTRSATITLSTVRRRASPATRPT